MDLLSLLDCVFKSGSICERSYEVKTRIIFNLVIQTCLTKSTKCCERYLRSSAGLWWTLRWLPVSRYTDGRWRHTARNVLNDPVPAVWQFHSNSSTAVEGWLFVSNPDRFLHALFQPMWVTVQNVLISKMSTFWTVTHVGSNEAWRSNLGSTRTAIP